MLSHIFQPIQIATLQLPNRVIMGSMHVGLEALDHGYERLTAFYVERAKGEAGLIVTGGAAVLPEGGGGVGFTNIYADEHIQPLYNMTRAVHDAGGRIALQLFHAGRYAYKEMTGLDPVAPSPLQAPINRTAPIEMNEELILDTIQAFANATRRAKEAGFDAVEIMGSEGYLINQFLSPVTNQRSDGWGGDFERRARFGLEIARQVKEVAGPEYPVFFRMSGLDVMPNSTTLEESVQFAKWLEKIGIDALNIGIGWHESQVPTISMMVPRASYVWVAKAIKEAVGIPVIASNRINDVRLANQIVAEGHSDLVSMARPFLADPYIVAKSRAGRFAEVNTCIACNQACLDHIFEGKTASCLVNPLAGREWDISITPAEAIKKVAVIGAGPAGMEAARVLALRGHDVSLWEKNIRLGGQLNFASQVPGKSEFKETLRYYENELRRLGVQMHLGEEATSDKLVAQGVTEVVLATGVTPRSPKLPGMELPHVVSYADVFTGKVPVGQQVVIIGAGGIACDLSHLLVTNTSFSAESGQYLAEYGIVPAKSYVSMQHNKRSITLLRRGKHVGTGLGKTTRWAVLALLKKHGVVTKTEIEYKEILPDGVRIIEKEQEVFIPADTVIIAAGSTPNRILVDSLPPDMKVHLIGGAKEAGELDAKRAIWEGMSVGREV
ncbi:NADPH-dependent 2,4-dienoyl-CoA reductase [Brevibacillus laterosporus]|uniref:NADPH-dependent 2,4-dienoyl-CoA reductase n=1 Tax=Brevibacillus laterosporus TaxID=1465 RepID=A0A518VEW5_BRELA|nr:FAD-dependent oxidoreductase [Brevibacillus laterosporus]QDX95541.1 NADPH-dependent 2,4-dienoyl-CoA reductase [Brevibacillus laterosporus]TPG69453.1 NADPH-dependent 2,4-dienoyl-CoA reductase [Brevibacillus laterosporus]